MHVSCIFSDKYQFVYVSTPKVACTSIKRALLPLLHEADMNKEEIEAETRFGNFHEYMRSTGVHMSKSTFQNMLGKGKYKNYYRFSFVRNPWDRLVSCYESKVVKNRGKPGPLKVKGKAGLFPLGMSFPEFIQVVCDIDEEDANVHFASQSLILGYSKDSSVKYIVDYIGRYENLAEDFAHVMDRIAPGRNIHLEKWNISDTRERRDYRRYYDDRLIELVSAKYADDIRLFEYSF